MILQALSTVVADHITLASYISEKPKPGYRILNRMYSKRQRLAAAAYILIRQKNNRKRSCWVREWIAKRPRLGAYNCLMQELIIEDPIVMRNFLRMDQMDMEELLNLVGGAITKKDTRMRLALPVKEKLALTLRFLASGECVEIYVGLLVL